MALKKIIIGSVSAIVILLVISVSVYFFIINSNFSPDYYLINQKGEGDFEAGDIVYGQLNQEEVVFLSVDDSDVFIPTYDAEDKFIVSEDFTPGQHQIAVKIGNKIFEQSINVQEGINIYDIQIDEIVPAGSDVDLITKVAGFATESIKEGNRHWVVQNVKVLDPNNIIVADYEDATSNVGVESWKLNLEFNIPTIGYNSGEYTAQITVEDIISGEKDRGEVKFIVQ